MTKQTFDWIAAGLRDALAYSEGDLSRARATNVMTHAGYNIRIVYDGIDDVLLARVLGIDEVVEVRARDIDALRTAIVEAVNDHILSGGFHPEPVITDADIDALFEDPDHSGPIVFAVSSPGKIASEWPQVIDRA